MKIYSEIKIKIYFGFLITLLLFSCNVTKSFAATADELAAQKADRQKQLDRINQQIRAFQQQIVGLQAQSSTLKNEITIYDNQISSTELQIQANQTRIEDTNLQIQELQKLIDQKKQDIADNKVILGQLIVQLNEFDDQFVLKSAFGSNNLSDFLDQVQYTTSVSGKVYQLVQKIKDLKLKLEEQQHELQLQLSRLSDLQEQLKITQQELSSQRSQKQRLLNQTKGSESNFQKLLLSSKSEEADIEKEMANLDAQIRAKLGNKTIAPNPGALAWPMDGILTQGYGNTGFTSLGYNFHNGIDLAAPAGQPIYSAADGNVLDIDYSDQGYGNWVAIKSSINTATGPRSIISLYGHFRAIKVKIGQVLKQGDIIGYEGNTGNTTKKLYGPERGYHLHFTIFDADGFGVQSGAYTRIYGPYRLPFGYTYNPLNFLPR